MARKSFNLLEEISSESPLALTVTFTESVGRTLKHASKIQCQLTWEVGSLVPTEAEFRNVQPS